MDRILRRRTTQESGARWRRTGDAGRCAVGSWRRLDRSGDRLCRIALGWADARAGGRRRGPGDDDAARSQMAKCGTPGPRSSPARASLLFTIDTMAVDGASGVMAALTLDGRSSEVQNWQTHRGRRRSRAGGSARHNPPSERRRARCDGVRSRSTGCRGTATHRRRAGRDRPGPGAVRDNPLRDRSSGQTRRRLRRHRPASHGGRRQVFKPRRPTSHGCGAPASRQTARRLAGVIIEGSRSDIWVADVSRGTATRLTHSGINSSPIWSADGRTIYFASRSDGAFDVWSRDAEGIQPATRVASVDGSRHAFPLAVSSDGTMLAFVQTSPGKRADIWVLPLAGGSPRAIRVRTIRRRSRDASLLTRNGRLPVGRHRTLGDLPCSVSTTAVASWFRPTAVNGRPGEATDSISSRVGS